jgi:endogenous inhibitor of DNA gyrase (YacG/DUF329 family)
MINTVALVVSLRRNNPKMSLQDIGNQCGVTKQRVYAILKKYNEQTAGIHRVTVNCAVCGKSINRIDSEVNRNGVNFCGRKCQGQYLGKGLYGKDKQ